MTLEENGYQVDYYTNAALEVVTPLANSLLAVTVTPGTILSYTTTNFTVDIQLADPVPSDGLVQILIPPEVTAAPSLGCRGLSGSVKIGTLTCQLLTQGGYNYV